MNWYLVASIYGICALVFSLIVLVYGVTQTDDSVEEVVLISFVFGICWPVVLLALLGGTIIHLIQKN